MSQVQLQNMMTSKFIGYFLEQVSNWQKKLSTADAVITIWFEVQITWSHLESIFIGSEDIRAQLPEQSKQFDLIDTDFKVSWRPGSNLSVCLSVMVVRTSWSYVRRNVRGTFDDVLWPTTIVITISHPAKWFCNNNYAQLRNNLLFCPVQALLKEVESVPNVVKATNRTRLFNELEDIQKRLSVCEKALAKYLETKRLAFPRFYFISSSDLLDILSKGNIPVEVCMWL